MSRMFNPPHPGETLREDVLPALGLTVTEAATQLGVTRAALSRVLNGRAAISPVMALRLEGWLGERRTCRRMAGAANRLRPLASKRSGDAEGYAVGESAKGCMSNTEVGFPLVELFAWGAMGGQPNIGCRRKQKGQSR